MECERLNRLVRSWYGQVQDESLAPARMVEFMEKHVENCDDCLADPHVIKEVKKITEIVLPVSKMTKPVKSVKPREVVLVEGGDVKSSDSDKDDTDQNDDDDEIDSDEDGDDEIDVDPDNI